MTDELKVIAISAHAADFCSRTGGTLIKYVKAGAKVRVLWMTQGETEESQHLYQQQPGISVDEVRKVREREAFAAAEVIGAEGRMFAFGDNPLRMTPDRIDMVAQEISDFNPGVILTHWHDERTHPTHHITSMSAVKAARLAQQSKMDIRFFEPHLGQAGRLGFAPDHYVNITDVYEQKMEALRKLAAQPDLPSNYTICNQWRGLECGGKLYGVEYAEGFVRYVRDRPVIDDLA